MWTRTKDELPPEGKYVLARHNRGTWSDSTDQDNVNCVVVKLVYGLSESQREQMKAGLLPDPEHSLWNSSGNFMCKRSEIYGFGDEGNGNNRVNYSWMQFGPDSFYGQEIYCWQEIEKE